MVGFLRAVRAPTSRLIFLAGLKRSCLRMNKPVFPSKSPGAGNSMFTGGCDSLLCSRGGQTEVCAKASEIDRR